MPDTSQDRGPLKVTKSQTSVVIFTEWHRIEGKVHTFPGSRLTDFMNASTGQAFLPVTEARVYPLSGGTPLYTPDFLNVNRNHITLIILQRTLPGEPSVSESVTADRRELPPVAGSILTPVPNDNIPLPY
jgi:hypothetical protein